MDPRRKYWISGGSFLLILTVGTLGYHVLEGWNLLDSLYMTIISVTTVGFSEVHPISRPETRLFTIFVILSGIWVVFYFLGGLAQNLLEGQIRDLLGRRKVKRRIQQMRDHCIVCGYGRIGQSICKELSLSEHAFVVVEKDPLRLSALEQEGFVGVLGDATSEEVLREAGIERAWSLIPAASSDADNVYITLTARGINPRLFIVARAAEEEAEKKLRWAGADRVVSPYRMSGRRIANLLLRPTVVEFIESSLYDPSVDLVLEELHLPDEGPWIGTTIMSSGIRKDFGLIVVAIKRKEGGLVMNPSPHEVLQGGDILIVLGRRPDLRRVERTMGKETGFHA